MREKRIFLLEDFVCIVSVTLSIVIHFIILKEKQKEQDTNN